jgi:predicted nucleotidyltransferase
VSNHGLNKTQIETTITILASFPCITSAYLFGSRAQGTASYNSDIDLVLYGAIAVEEADLIRDAFAESDLILPVDLLVFDRIESQLLKAHIEQVKELFYVRSEQQ